jgi:hypothetical protein
MTIVYAGVYNFVHCGTVTKYDSPLFNADARERKSFLQQSKCLRPAATGIYLFGIYWDFLINPHTF